MNSTTERSATSAAPPSNGQAGSRIKHYDATTRRKDKMRQKATGEAADQPPAVAAVAAPAQAVPAPAPQPVAPAVEKRNGAFAHPAASQPAPAAAAPVGSNGSHKTNGVALPSGAELEKFLVAFVVEQTGYPEEMVELDADLEADLGIDSIKKAQLFGELAERFHVNVQGADELSLDDFATLRHVKRFLDSAAIPPAAKPAPSPAVPIAATPAVAPTAPVPALAASAPSTDNAMPQGAELEKFLVEFVVEQTGYPEEMVELDADLEGDLGIDSIKKAQLFGELAEQFEINIQSAEDLSLDDFPTLRHVMQFLQGSAQPSPDKRAAPVAAAGQPATFIPPPASLPLTPVVSATAAPAGATLSGAELEEFLINFVVEQTGYPPEMVELDADLESDLGIDSIKKAQLFGELAEQFDVNVEAQDAEELSLDDFSTLRHVMQFLEGVPQQATALRGGGF